MAKKLLLILDFDQTLTKDHTQYDQEKNKPLANAKQLTDLEIKQNMRHPVVMRAIINAFHAHDHKVGIASFNEGTDELPQEYYIYETLRVGLPGINLDKLRIRSGTPDDAIMDEFGKTFYYSDHIDEFNKENELENIDISNPLDAKRVIVLDDDPDVIKLAIQRGYTGILMPEALNDITPYVQLALLGGLTPDALKKEADEILNSPKAEHKEEAEFIGRLIKAIQEQEAKFKAKQEQDAKLRQDKPAPAGLVGGTVGIQSLDPKVPVPTALQDAAKGKVAPPAPKAVPVPVPAAQNTLPMEEIISLAVALGLTPEQFMKQQRIVPATTPKADKGDKGDRKDSKELEGRENKDKKDVIEDEEYVRFQMALLKAQMAEAGKLKDGKAADDKAKIPLVERKASKDEVPKPVGLLEAPKKGDHDTDNAMVGDGDDDDAAAIALAIKDSLQEKTAVERKAKAAAAAIPVQAPVKPEEPAKVNPEAAAAAAPKKPGPNLLMKILAKEASKKDEALGLLAGLGGTGPSPVPNAKANKNDKKEDLDVKQNFDIQQRAAAVVTELDELRLAEQESEIDQLATAMEMSDPSHNKLYYLNLLIKQNAAQNAKQNADLTLDADDALLLSDLAPA